MANLRLAEGRHDGIRGQPRPQRGPPIRSDAALYHVGGIRDEEQNDQHYLGVVALDALRDVLHDRRLSRFRRRHDQASLTLADRRKQVDDSSRHVLGVTLALLHKFLVWEQRGQLFEVWSVLCEFRALTVDGLDAQQRRVLLVPVGWPARTNEVVTLTQSELANLG